MREVSSIESEGLDVCCMFVTWEVGGTESWELQRFWPKPRRRNAFKTVMTDFEVVTSEGSRRNAEGLRFC